jgi:hypothetical protein
MRRDPFSASKFDRKLVIYKDEAIILDKTFMPGAMRFIKPGNHNRQAVRQHGGDGATLADEMGRSGGDTEIGLLKMTGDLHRWERAKLAKGEARRSKSGEITPESHAIGAGNTERKKLDRVYVQKAKDSEERRD